MHRQTGIAACGLLVLLFYLCLEDTAYGRITNLALDKPATCSSYEADYTPDRAVDGDLGTSWFTAVGDAASSPFAR